MEVARLAAKLERVAGKRTGSNAGVAVARALRVMLLGIAFVAAACSNDDSPRCAADRSLAEACADDGCPRDLQAALTAGKACDTRFGEQWQEGDQRAVGVATGLGGRLYHFDGNQLVGVEFWTDVLGDCPSSYVNGRATVSVREQFINAPRREVCALCSEWAVAEERPLCP